MFYIAIISMPINQMHMLYKHIHPSLIVILQNVNGEKTIINENQQIQFQNNTSTSAKESNQTIYLVLCKILYYTFHSNLCQSTYLEDEVFHFHLPLAPADSKLNYYLCAICTN